MVSLDKRSKEIIISISTENRSTYKYIKEESKDLPVGINFNKKEKKDDIPSGLCGDAVSFFLAQIPIYIFVWIMRHTLKDIDNYVWVKLKNILADIFLKNTVGKKINVIGIYKNNNFAFVFGKDLTKKMSIIALQKMKDMLDKKGFSKKYKEPMIFVFNKKVKKWVPEKEKAKEYLKLISKL